LTAERFVPDPLTTSESGARLYRSGDLVRFRPEGRSGFLGRLDHQVKIRGFRVEVGEIEDALRRHPALAEAAVAVRTAREGPPRLVAYVVAGGDSPKPSDLRRHLRSWLPEHMLPAQFELLADLPRMPNGKIDRPALPEPEARRELDEGPVPPEGEFEVLLADIWSAVLGVETIGRRDNFFELGGHSLLATQVLARLREHLEVDLPLLALFEMPTIEELALAVEETVLERLEALEEPSQGSEQDPVYAV
jgi:acyl carrier protein